MNTEFIRNKFSRYDDTTEKLGDHVFGIRLPIEVEKKYLKKPPKERVALMRKILVEGLVTKPHSRSKLKRKRKKR